MFGWMQDAAGSIAGWLGEGVASFFEWLFGGLLTIVTKVVNACNNVFDVLDSLWNFAIGLKDNLFGLIGAFFPFVPEAVMTVISLGLLAILLAGIVKKVWGK